MSSKVKERERERKRNTKKQKNSFRLIKTSFINLSSFSLFFKRLRDRPRGAQGLARRLRLLLRGLLLRLDERSHVGRGAQAVEELPRGRGAPSCLSFALDGIGPGGSRSLAARCLGLRPPRRRRGHGGRGVSGPAEDAGARGGAIQLLDDGLRHQRGDARGGGAQGEGAGADE